MKAQRVLEVVSTLFLVYGGIGLVVSYIVGWNVKELIICFAILVGIGYAIHRGLEG